MRGGKTGEKVVKISESEYNGQFISESSFKPSLYAASPSKNKISYASEILFLFLPLI